MSKLKKYFLVFLVTFYTFISLLTPHIVSAQDESAWYHREYDDWYQIVFTPDNPDEIFGERYTYAQVEWVIYSVAAFILNAIGNANLMGCILNNRDDLDQCAGPFCQAVSDIGFIPDGTIAGIVGIPACEALFSLVAEENQNTDAKSQALAVVGSRPISGISYLKERLNKLHIVPEVKAQGFGFGAAEPIRTVWIAVRNFTYFLLIVVMVVMAFMIMFRIRTSPQTVITIQSAIPKLIAAMILITFSYAIAGFMIDLMYVIIGFIAAIIANSNITDQTAQEIFINLSTGYNALTLMLLYLLIFSMAAFWALVSNVYGVIGIFLGGATIVVWLILVIIMSIILLIAAFRIFFLLIRNFVLILLTIIIGPIQILIGTLGSGGFGSWLRTLLSYLMVYPAMGVMFFLAFYFLRAAFPSGGFFFGGGLFQQLVTAFIPFHLHDVLPITAGGWSPPFTGGTEDTDILWLFASVVVVTLIPRVADIVQSFFSGRPFGYGSAITESLGRGVAPFAAGWAAARGFAGQQINTRVIQPFISAHFPQRNSRIDEPIGATRHNSGRRRGSSGGGNSGSGGSA